MASSTILSDKSTCVSDVVLVWLKTTIAKKCTGTMQMLFKAKVVTYVIMWGGKGRKRSTITKGTSGLHQ